MGNAGPKINDFEIVMVKNERVDLFASLVSLKGGKAVVNGQVILGHEKRVQFSSDTNFRGALRSEFLAACPVEMACNPIAQVVLTL